MIFDRLCGVVLSEYQKELCGKCVLKKAASSYPLVPRRDVVTFARKQLDSDKCSRPKGHKQHYGKQELRELLDMIYGGPPKTEEEEL